MTKHPWWCTHPCWLSLAGWFSTWLLSILLLQWAKNSSSLVLVGSGRGYQFCFSLRCWVGLGWIGFPDKVDINWGCVHGYQLATSCTNWNLKKVLTITSADWFWVVYTVTSWSRSVLCSQAIRQCAQEPPGETRQDWTGLNWTGPTTYNHLDQVLVR